MRFIARRPRPAKDDDALATVRHFTAQPDAPAYFYYLQAETWAAKKNLGTRLAILARFPTTQDAR